MLPAFPARAIIVGIGPRGGFLISGSGERCHIPCGNRFQRLDFIHDEGPVN